MSIFRGNKWVQYYLPVTLVLFTMVIEERAVVDDDGWDRLYGFPFAYISGNIGCTGCYEVFVVALLFDLLIYLIFVLLLFKGIEKLGFRLKTHWFPNLIGLLISLMCIGWFYLTTQDSSFKLINDLPYKTTHTQFDF